MFRLLVEPNEPKGSADYIPVFDKIYEDFNTFKIDPDSRTIEVDLSIKENHIGRLTYTEMQDLLKESWDHYKLKYEFAPYPSSMVKVFIPDGYHIQVILH